MRIGVTGGIGSGKSYVSRLLTSSYGIAVYDSDTEAKRLMTASPAIRQSLVQLLGEEVYSPAGALRKAVVAEYLFASEEHARNINAIVHPVVKQDFLLWAQGSAGDVALESAILVEAGFRDVVDCLLLVAAPEEMRLCRAMARDGATEQQVRERMGRQLPESEVAAVADFVVVNDGRELMSQLQEFYTFIHKDISINPKDISICSKQS